MLALQGSNATTVQGFQATISLPTGVSVRTDARGEVQAGVVTASGSAANGYAAGKYSAATTASLATLAIDLISATTLTAGDVIVLSVDLAAGSAIPADSAFPITAGKFVTTGGTDVGGTSLTLHK